MFKLNEIKELIKLLDQTSVQELEIENEGSRLTIRKPGNQEVIHIQQAHDITHSQGQSFIQQPSIDRGIEVSAHAPTVHTEAKAQTATNLYTIESPMVGTFYRSSSPDASPFVSTGDKVTERTAVCIIEAMKLMNELEAEVRGEIVEILVENGQLVEYGQPLFLVKPE